MKFLLLALLLIPSLSMAGGTISGTVRYVGIPPVYSTIPVTTDLSVCGLQKSESLLLEKKLSGIRNIVVSIRGGASGGKGFSVPENGFVMEQKECRFDPHVLILPLKQSLTVFNRDGVLHNFHTYGRVNLETNRAQPASVPEIKISFDRAETVQVRCDVHPWMEAWIVVAEHPYYTLTDEQGRFSMSDVPAGEYTIQFWHEKLGLREKKIRVRESENTKVDLKMRIQK